MSANLMLRYPSQATSSDGNLTARYKNTTNTPIVSMTWLANGQAIAGTYVLTFTKSGTVTVDVSATGDGASSRNPWDRSGLSVTADGSTVNKDIIPGLGIVVSASTDTGWAAKITVGNYLSGAAAEDEVLEFEVIVAGSTSSDRQVACRNIGTETAQGVTIYALPGFYFDGVGAESFISTIQPHSSPTYHKGASVEKSVTITFTNWGDDIPSGKKKADILVDGSTCVSSALFDGATVYEYGVAGYDSSANLLQGLGIRLPDTTSDPTSASITLAIRAGYTWIELAPDNSGSAGSWATSDLSLGDIPAASHELFWIRCAVPSAATPDDPCRMVNVRARGLSI